jgi:hypothetical protein
MGFIAKTSGGSGDYKRIPAGVYVARAYSLVDLGTQTTNGQYGEKQQKKIRLSWEVFGEDEGGQPLTIEIDGKQMPLTVSKNYTMSLHEKASLRKELSAWRGRDFTEEEAQGFDISKLVGAYCMANIQHSEKDGKTYTNVVGLTPLPSALKNSKPAPVHANILFDLDAPDMDLFWSFPEWLQNVINLSPEWQARNGQQAPQAASQSAPQPAAQAANSVAEMTDNIPF